MGIFSVKTKDFYVSIATKRRHPQFKKLLSVVSTKRVAVRDYLYASIATKRRHPQFKKLLSVVRTKRVAVRDYPEDLFVDPALRGKGIGKALITYLAKLATERECGRLEWSVLDWN